MMWHSWSSVDTRRTLWRSRLPSGIKNRSSAESGSLRRCKVRILTSEDPKNPLSTHQDFRSGRQTIDSWFLKVSKHAQNHEFRYCQFQTQWEWLWLTGNSFFSFLCCRLGGCLGLPPFTSSSESLSVRRDQAAVNTFKISNNVIPDSI